MDLPLALVFSICLRGLLFFLRGPGGGGQERGGKGPIGAECGLVPCFLLASKKETPNIGFPFFVLFSGKTKGEPSSCGSIL